MRRGPACHGQHGQGPPPASWPSVGDLFDQGWVFGKKVYVKGHGVFEIADLMNKRHKERVDIFFPNADEARRFGIKQVKVALLAG